MTTQSQNLLYYGDNLEVLRRHIKDETIDLVYLDPPFNSNATYNVLFAEKNGSQAAAQIKAFEDTWHWDQTAAKSYHEVVEGGGKVSQVMQAFHTFLGENDMLAYLAMMAPRLVELRRGLKLTGSIYLHCDPTASHYLKLLMDAIFGQANFRNEIIWNYGRGAATIKSALPKGHETLLFYSRSANNFWDAPKRPYSQKLIRSLKKDEGGYYYTRGQRTGRRELAEWEIESGVGLKTYVDLESGGTKCTDIWDDIGGYPRSNESLGYPTQKPEALLERIIQASSNKGDTVLDPFCGCGTTISAAQKIKRRWIGIDITYLAINLIKHRLHNAFGKRIKYEVIGEPVSLPDAKELAQQAPHQFQWWALGLVNARPTEQKKGADKGIDGRLYFHDDPKGKTKQIILSVKAGENVSVPHLRDLRGVLDREKAEIGVLISMAEPTRPMKTEAASAGFYTSAWDSKKYSRLQILTIKELLEGKEIDYPAYGANVTFKKAAKVEEEVEVEGLPFGKMK